MKKLLVVLLALMVVPAILSAKDMRRYKLVEPVRWNGVDSLSFTGADTARSDTITMGNYGFIYFEAQMSQAGDSCLIDSVVFRGSVAGKRRYSNFEVFRRRKDTDGSRSWCLLFTAAGGDSVVSGTYYNEVFPGAPPLNRGIIDVYISSSKNGTNAKLVINKIQTF